MRLAQETRDGLLAVRATFFFIALLSFGYINPAAIGLGQADTSSSTTPRQQVVILLLWLAILGCSLLPRARRFIPATSGIGWLILFLAYVAVSPLWSSDPIAAAPKAIAFVIISFAVWRLTMMLSFVEFIRLCQLALWVLMVASLLLCLTRPGIALSHDYFHNGDWIGVFDQKQELGITAAFFVYLSSMRLLRERRLIDALGLALGLLLLIKSGSRGSAIIATLGPITIFAARRFPVLYSAVLGLIKLEFGLALAVIAYMAVTGADAIVLGGATIDLTQRTYIWNYTIEHWLSRPYFGYGINGFWTNADIRWGFERVYGWVLDNDHSGYITILAETGVVGMTLFAVILFQFCARIRLSLRAHSQATALMVGLTLMLTTINLSETLFLRSTNLGQVIFTFCLIKVLARHPNRAALPAVGGTVAPARG